MSAGVEERLPLLQLVILAIIQGLTEFLPVSSSAHLILVPALTGWRDQGLAIDVAMHLGTLGAVLLFFRKDVIAVTRGAALAIRGEWTPKGRLAFQIVAATMPVVIAGYVFRNEIAIDFRSPALIAAATGAFGVLLWLADRRAHRGCDNFFYLSQFLSWRVAMLIGLAQALALVPGVSRSGVTMTAALFLGLGRTEAARFSLLLSIPTTAAAGALSGFDLLRSGDAALQTDALIAGVFAFIAGLAAIWGLMSWLRRATFAPFVAYRLLLSAVLAALIFIGVM